MIEDQIQAAEQRWAARQEEREGGRALGESLLTAANSQEAIRERLAHLRAFAGTPLLPIEDDDEGGGRALIPEEDAPGDIDAALLERILDRSDLVSVVYLETALAASRSVARVRIQTSPGLTRGYGSGAMITPRLFLTNHHVLGTPDDARFSLIEFNYQEQVGGADVRSTLFELDPDSFFVADDPLDYALVAVKPVSQDNESRLADFGYLRVSSSAGKVLVGEYLNIIQHPRGQLKQLALRENQLIDMFDDFLHYRTDTEPGSSGSPVFNDQWEVVGLHHAGVPNRDENGRILARDGTLWTRAKGSDQIDWIANEGIQINSVIRHVLRQQFRRGSSEESFRDELVAEVDRAGGPAPAPAAKAPGVAAPMIAPAATVPQSTSAGDSEDTGPAAGATATVSAGAPTGSGTSWTIPLQITIQVGEATASGGGSTSSGAAGGGVATSDPDVDQALSDLDAARDREYYDAAADESDREGYYAGLDDTLSTEERFNRLSALVRDTHHTTLSYKPTNHVYPWVDLQPNRMLRSVYSGREFEPEVFIREDFRIEQERAAAKEALMARESEMSEEAFEEAIDLIEALRPYNCEHVVPQSWFRKRQPMKGDLHHLFACEAGCNSFRQNLAYWDFPDFEEAIRDDCGKREGTNKFEPSAGKGAVARATMYFLLRYPRELRDSSRELRADRLPTLLAWHEAHPVSEWERHRNQAIFALQGNRNPLIDHPDWGAQIAWELGLDR